MVFFWKLYFKKMWLLSVKPSDREDKRYEAKICMCEKKMACKGTNTKKVHFGQPDAETYVDGASEQKKKSYLARHSKSPGEDWSKPDTPGALSRFLLWGSSRSIRDNIKKFKEKFSL